VLQSRYQPKADGGLELVSRKRFPDMRYFRAYVSVFDDVGR